MCERGVLQVTVQVQDVNDHWPQFISPPHFSVSEDAPLGSSVFQLTASDADKDEAGRVTYRLAAGGGEGAFSVSGTDGVVRTRRQLDRETQQRHQFTVVATDSGTPARSTSALVTVDVADANDHSPAFTSAQYFTSVPEQTPVGGVVPLNLSAVDADEGLNAQVRYDVISGDEFGTFALDGYTGELSVRRALERVEYRLRVVARDLGTPARSSTVDVIVSVDRGTTQSGTTQRATSPPSFLASPYVGHVVENMAAPCHVTQVWARTDRDVTVTYALADRDLSDLFSVNASTGHVTTVAILDRERAAVYTFNIIAVTSGLYSVTV